MTDNAIQTARRALAMLDLTDLSDTCTEAQIERLCMQARTPHGPVAAVCIWPQHVKLARQRLSETKVCVATVVNFPAGTSPLNRVLADVEETLGDGAQEIDLVMPYRDFLSNGAQGSAEMIGAVSDMLGDGQMLKVILETGLYPDQEKIAEASRLAINNGADFIKTSTGKAAVSATPEAVRTMLHVIRDLGSDAGLKIAGGVRTRADAENYLAMTDEIMGADWARPATFRFGASALYDSLIASIDGSQTPGRRADY